MTPKQLREAANGPWEPRTIYCGPGQEYEDWRDALRHAPSGSTIVVVPKPEDVEDLGHDGRTT